MHIHDAPRRIGSLWLILRSVSDDLRVQALSDTRAAEVLLLIPADLNTLLAVHS